MANKTQLNNAIHGNDLAKDVYNLANKMSGGTEPRVLTALEQPNRPFSQTEKINQ